MTNLSIGDQAPDFSAPNETGEIVSLSDFRGRKLVLFFYPQDNTPTCTAEACNLRDNFGLIKTKGYEVLGVSPDSLRRHVNFREKHGLPFSLLSDPENKMAQDYGIWAEKTLFGHRYMGILRTTFVIDESGKIENIISKVDSKDHAAQILG